LFLLISNCFPAPGLYLFYHIQVDNEPSVAAKKRIAGKFLFQCFHRFRGFDLSLDIRCSFFIKNPFLNLHHVG